MCDTCGCGQPENTVTFKKPGTTDHMHADGTIHTHEHDHTHSHEHGPGRIIKIETDILKKNNILAAENRNVFESKNITVLNLVSSPGSGKTTLLEKTLVELKNCISCAVIEGDQQTLRDAERIDATGVPVLQINTGSGCHLDSSMIRKSVEQMNLKNNSILFIENVGNLVCPALFDLGESKKVVVISVTEGDDKPEKYPTMFSVADLCIINKTDLLPYVDFDIEKCKLYAKRTNPAIQFIELSAKSGDGMKAWEKWLLDQTN
jgi:hydrogenase nickel incorporation protein HypB